MNETRIKLDRAILEWWRRDKDLYFDEDDEEEIISPIELAKD